MDFRPTITEPALSTTPKTLDVATSMAVRAFLDRLRGDHDLREAFVFGSRARGDHRPDSDADVAVVLAGAPGDRYAVVMTMSDAAYDVLLETGIYIQPVPLWEAEMQSPELFSNPTLIESIKRDGLRL